MGHYFLDIYGRSYYCRNFFNASLPRKSYYYNAIIFIALSKGSNQNSFLSLQPMGRGALYCTVMWFFAQKKLRQPIPDNSWLFSTFWCGCPYEHFLIPLYLSFWNDLHKLLSNKLQVELFMNTSFRLNYGPTKLFITWRPLYYTFLKIYRRRF